MIDPTYWQRRAEQIQLLDHVEAALRAVGREAPIRRRRSVQVITPTAILTPAWFYDRHGESRLVLRVKGRLSPIELGALHLKGLL